MQYFCRVRSVGAQPQLCQLKLQVIWKRGEVCAQSPVFMVGELPTESLQLQLFAEQGPKSSIFSLLTYTSEQTRRQIGFSIINLQQLKQTAQTVNLQLSHVHISLEMWYKVVQKQTIIASKRRLDGKDMTGQKQSQICHFNNLLQLKIVELEGNLMQSRADNSQLQANVDGLITQILKMQKLAGMPSQKLDLTGLVNYIQVLSYDAKAPILSAFSNNTFKTVQEQQIADLTDRLSDIQGKLIATNLQLDSLKFAHASLWKTNQAIKKDNQREMGQMIDALQQQRKFGQQQFNLAMETKSELTKAKFLLKQKQEELYSLTSRQSQFSLNPAVDYKIVNTEQPAQQERQWPSAVLVKNRIIRVDTLTNLKLDIAESLPDQSHVCNNTLLKDSQKRYLDVLSALENQRQSSRNTLQQMSRQVQKLAADNKMLQVKMQQKQSELSRAQLDWNQRLKRNPHQRQLVHLRKQAVKLVHARSEIQALQKQNEQIVDSLLKYKSVVQQAQRQIILLRREQGLPEKKNRIEIQQN